MLDLHCHILPAVDDGAGSLDEALALARFCVQEGITHVVATPHCHRHCRMLRADVLPHVTRLNEDLAAAGIMHQPHASWLPYQAGGRTVGSR